MCGIAGVVGPGNREERAATVRRMTAAIAHRGPDGEGYFHDADVSLGHRRLSIIDRASGKQPLCNEDESIWLTYNGEIYNFRELRQQLESNGHRFRTNCDSEVIVHAYEQWGAECVERFRGMFAFALVDLPANRTLLARDQLGIKPLYYRCTSTELAFASELPALLKACDRSPEISPQSIDFFLRYRYIPAPHTGYDSIYKLPPATYQVYDFRGTLVDTREYWSLRFAPKRHKTADEWLDEFEQVLMDSVRAHLVADVPFGAFLSGGIDSTLVVACMAKLLNHPVRAYTIGFDEQEFSEHSFACQAAETLGIELHHEVVRPNIVDALEKLFTNYGEPFADTSAVPTWWVSALARRDVPMVLSGDGADEAFAGYHRYGRWIDDSLASDARSLFKYPKRLVRRFGQLYRHGLNAARRHRWEQDFVGLMDYPRRAKLWQPDFDVVNEACPAFARAAEQANKYDKLSFAQYVDIKTYLPGDILTKVDIASMQHGLEVRTPFTDVKVMEMAATLPIELRCQRHHGRQRLKVLPKRSLARTFPSEFVDRNKMGFAIPESHWMRKGSPVRACFDDLLSSSSSRLFDYLQRSEVEKLKHDFDQRGSHAAALWSLFALVYWMDQQTASGQVGRAA